MLHQASFPQDVDALTLAAVTNAVPLARRLVKEVARHWRLPDELTENSVIITSELMTNAIKATADFHTARGIPEAGRVRLSLRWKLPSLFTMVWDINPLLPVKREADGFDTSGRGIGIIEVLSFNWSAAHCREGGKLVWTEQRLS
jgi:anti-sigma regulatory factor (Ser/Thr protein kinase)